MFRFVICVALFKGLVFDVRKRKEKWAILE